MSALIFLAAWFVAASGLAAVFGRRLWPELTPLLRVYLVLGWALVAIGILQAAFTPMKFGRFDEAALWFATAGMGIALAGAVNLLNVGRRLQDPGVRRACLAANLVATAVFVAVATHRGTEGLHDPVSAVLIAVGTLAALLGSGLRGAGPRRSVGGHRA